MDRLADVVPLHRPGCVAERRVRDEQEQASRDRATAQALREHLAGVQASPTWPVAAAAQLHEARARARVVADGAGAVPERREALELVVSELLGNAVRHGRAPVRYEVVVDADDLVLTVTDGEPTPPAPGSCCDADAETGRGLFLVGQLARCWGWTPLPTGKRVWARL